jgi:hypothetical protein
MLTLPVLADEVFEVDYAGLLHLWRHLAAVDDLEQAWQIPRRCIQALEHSLSRLTLTLVLAQRRRKRGVKSLRFHWGSTLYLYISFSLQILVHVGVGGEKNKKK